MTHREHTETAHYLVRRLAMLISGGVNPSAVWEFLSNDSNVGPLATSITQQAVDGVSTPQSLSRLGLPEVAAVWHVAETAGAPMAQALNRLAAQFDALSDAARKREVAFAGPKSTMRLVLILPLIGIGFSFLLGFNALGVLLTTPVGWLMSAVGAALIVTGRVWSNTLIGRAAGSVRLPGYVAELMAVALAGGTSVQRAKLHVTDALDTFRVPGVSLQELTAPHSAVMHSISLAEQAGVSVTKMLTAEAASARREYAGELDVSAAKLGVTLMIPLGVCILPAFIVLSVLPMMVSIFQQGVIS